MAHIRTDNTPSPRPRSGHDLRRDVGTPRVFRRLFGGRVINDLHLMGGCSRPDALLECSGLKGKI